MTITVQISDFRKNIADYMGKLDAGNIIDIKKGNKYLAKLSQHPKAKAKKHINDVDKFLADIEKIRKEVGPIRMKAKNEEELVNEIDRIVYGVDRNGKELSEDDR